MEDFGEKKEKEILKRTLSYYNKRGGPLFDEGKMVNKIKIMEKTKPSLWIYIIGVVVVLSIINFFVRSQNVAVFSGGFLMGMLAMYIAVHLYKYK